MASAPAASATRDRAPGPGDYAKALINILEDFADDPTYQELRSALESLNEDERAELLALTFVGRGDFTKDEWSEAMAEARDVMDAHVVDYLIGIPLLGDYVEEGFAAFGHSCEDVELGRL